MSDYRAVVITISTRAAAGVYEDRSGPILVNGLRELGFEVGLPVVVADGEPVTAALRAALQSDFDLILTSGGTGISPTDKTPELTAAFITQPLPGISEALRADAATNGVPMGMLSRGVAGVAGSSLLINLPGSAAAARDGLRVLAPVLKHAIDQRRGVDH